MPEMFLALSSTIAAVTLIVAVLSSIQRRRLAAELAVARRDAALALSKHNASQGLLDQHADEGKKAGAIVASAQAALAARDPELDALRAELGEARAAEAKARTKSAAETQARAGAEASAAQEIEELRRLSEAAQAEAHEVSKLLVDASRRRTEVELLLDREKAKAKNAAAGEAQIAGLQAQIGALEAAAAKQKALEAAAASKQKALEAAAAATRNELAAVRKEADEARAAEGAARARVSAIEAERAQAAAAAEATAAATSGATAPAAPGEGGGVASAIQADPALNRGQKETLRMMYDRFTAKAAKP